VGEIPLVTESSPSWHGPVGTGAGGWLGRAAGGVATGGGAALVEPVGPAEPPMIGASPWVVWPGVGAVLVVGEAMAAVPAAALVAPDDPGPPHMVIASTMTTSTAAASRARRRQ
jgi:hypothetical protein